MKRQHLFATFTGILVVMGVLFTIPACAAGQTRAYIRVGPPAPLVERVVVAPGPNYIWVPGFYRWDSRAYVWVPGRYVVPPRPRAAWVPGHWTHSRSGWYWIEGHWR